MDGGAGIEHVVRLREYQLALRDARQRRLARRANSYSNGVVANGHSHSARYSTGVAGRRGPHTNGGPVGSAVTNGHVPDGIDGGWMETDPSTRTPRFHMLGVTIPELLVAKHRRNFPNRVHDISVDSKKNSVARGDGDAMKDRRMMEKDGQQDDDRSAATSSSGCSYLLVLRLLDMLMLLGLCIAQGSLLNFLIIWHLQRSHVVYLWFLADFVVVMCFVAALTTSYQRVARLFYRRATKSGSPLKSPGDTPTYGTLPLGYLSWLLYSGVLVAKIVVIFKWEIADRLGDEELFTPQLLKVVLGGGASLVFLLLVNAHRPPSHPDDDGRAYIASLCTVTAFEIFDAVAFLELLFVEETRLVLPYPLETIVLVLASANLLLPSLALYRLSLADFGRQQRSALLGLIYSTVKLLAIESPYLGIRVYLWSFYGASTSSIFMLKNVLMIVVKMRYVIPEYVKLLMERRARRKKVEDGPYSSSTITRTSHLEMSTIS